MTRLLTRPALGDPQVLGRPSPACDPFTLDLVAAAREEGYRAGIADGAAAAREEASIIAARSADALRTAVGEVRMLLSAREASAAAETVELARRIAVAALGREPADDTDQLLAALRGALETLDDDHLVVRVHPAALEVVHTGLADAADVTVTADPAMAPGEARIRGRFADADLTRAGRIAAVEETLDASA